VDNKKIEQAYQYKINRALRQCEALQLESDNLKAWQKLSKNEQNIILMAEFRELNPILNNRPRKKKYILKLV
jgi:hypothetical protein